MAVNKHPSLPNLLTPKDVMEYLHIGSDSVYTLMKKKTFPSFRMGRRYYITEDKFIEWMDMQSKKLFMKHDNT